MNARSLSLMFGAFLAQTLLLTAGSDILVPRAGIDLYLGSMLVAIVAFLPILWFATPGGLRTEVTRTRERLGAASAFGILGLFLAMSLVVPMIEPVIDALGQALGSGAKTGVGEFSTSVTVWSILYGALVGPVIEELSWRATMMRRLAPLGAWRAIAISSLCFALMHHSLGQGISAFFAGLFFGYVAQRYGVRWSILLHIIGNSLAALVPLLKESSVSTLAQLVIIAIAAAGSLTALVRWFLGRRKQEVGPIVAVRASEGVSSQDAATEVATQARPALATLWPMWVLIVFDAVMTLLKTFHVI